jgi:hypothetical protein
MDYYLNDDHVVERLVKEWKAHGKLIIAYDFDNTVFDYHNENHQYNQVISLLRECYEFGAYLIVFTASEESRFPQIRSYLEERKIPFDYINEDVHHLLIKGRKLYYNILLDDRAGLSSAYKNLKQALEIMKENIHA